MKTTVVLLFAAICMLAGGGCFQPLTTDDALVAFNAAGPVRLHVDADQLVKAVTPVGPYRVVPDDLIVLEMPEVLRAVSDDSFLELLNDRSSRREGLLSCRVDAPGQIHLPAAGPIHVAGKTVGQIESAVVAAYYPKFLRSRPPITVSVRQYRTARVAIVGAVKKPGVYVLRSDEMSLLSLITKAEGLTPEGSGIIRIDRGADAGEARKVVLPVRDLYIPFADVALAGGEIVEVERYEAKFFTVLGLVDQPGSYPYPEGAQYNLMQAIGFAGGIGAVEPQYVKVHRQDRSGDLATVVFRLKDLRASPRMDLAIKPGDVVALDHTLASRITKLLTEVLRIQTGFVYDAGY